VTEPTGGSARRLDEAALRTWFEEQTRMHRFSGAALAWRDEAFRWLDKGVEGRSECMPYARVDPRLDLIRSDPRFAALLRRIGLSAATASPQASLGFAPCPSVAFALSGGAS